MKKTLILLAAIALLLVLFITVNFMKTMNEDDNIEQTQPESGPSEEAWDPDAAPEQVAKVEGATTTFPVDQSSTEQEVMDTMHFMTHQKVMAEKKTGAVEMTKENVEKVFSILQSSHFERKEKLLEIAAKWRNDNFLDIIEDHNYFWELDAGQVGKAYRVLKPSDEERFIENNFRNP
ncbi:DUF6241 domain-containing protein [Bacillus infantis]|uniref:DUF6241 domain-containing protein n=1 Tax=Bacillus infantis TaxID=324767 RepID=UPI0021555790|nr:DUF6241 domain-containing protein [Bacillus infantis]MCR6609579.1 DUF6241 domain-containing protein [Bacillus infantis]